jgi:ferritin-like metal-binding protein YciE
LLWTNVSRIEWLKRRTRYGTLKTWAQELGLDQSVLLLNLTVGEEKKTGQTMTEPAQSNVNRHAEAA